ncbi:MAG: phosphoribosylanthranilate isomerase [Chloroflexota bacterium]|nr:phosphoribosylanthranilate isomerase [Chloroflexota bacterium]
MIIQIYAFTDPKTAVAAVEMGVDHVGFVAGKYNEVPAELSFKEARAIVDALPPQATPVALTMAVDLDEIMRMVEAVQPSIVHISSDVDLVNVEMMRKLHERLAGQARLMKAIPVEDEASVAVAKAYAAVSDILLLDTKHADFPGVGATGKTHDWNVSRRIVETAGIPVIMAGGLTPENVGAAMQQIQPWAVDSNTSTNVEGSNVDKDLTRIRAFVDAVHAQEKKQG